jgi:hypothetical protein
MESCHQQLVCIGGGRIGNGECGRLAQRFSQPAGLLGCSTFYDHD